MSPRRPCRRRRGGRARRATHQLVDPLVEELQDNRDLLAKGLREVGFPVTGAEGTYFLTVDISELTDEDAGTPPKNCRTAAAWLLCPALCSTGTPRLDATGCVSLSASVALRSRRQSSAWDGFKGGGQSEGRRSSMTWPSRTLHGPAATWRP